MVIVKVPPVTETGLSWTWFSVPDVRNGVKVVGGNDRFERVTVAVIACFELFVRTSATLPLVGLTAVACKLELVEVEASTTEPGRMKRLKFPRAYARFGT